MNIINFIKNIFKKKLILDSSACNLVNSLNGKKIYYDNIHGIESAKIINEELNNNVDLYTAFLEEYDAIVIGECNEVEGKILKIENLIEPKKDGNSIYRDNYVEKMIESISLQYDNFNIKQIFENVKTNKLIDKLHNFRGWLYSMVVKNEGNIDNYIDCLSIIKDYKGLKMLCQSSDVRVFEEQYLELNLVKILNESFESFIDKGENNFLEKNIALISKAINYTGTSENFSQALLLSDIRVIEKAIKSNEIDELTKQKCFRKIENVIGDSEWSPFIKRKCNRILHEKENNQNLYISNEQMIKLVKDFLHSIDHDGKLVEFFEKKFQDGKIILYDKNNIQEKKNEIINKLPEEYKSEINNFFDGTSFYNRGIDTCFVATGNKITDVSIIVHEVIHQYSNNIDNAYLGEVTSIFFERLCDEYLINNGWNANRDEIRDSFEERIYNDCFNNCCELKQRINLLECKLKKKSISVDDVLSDELAVKLNYLEHLSGESKVNCVNDLKARKIWEVKKVIKENVCSNNEIKLRNRKLISYALGTYFAAKYLDNKEVISKMLELVKNPYFEFKNITDFIEQKEHSKENKKIEECKER